MESRRLDIFIPARRCGGFLKHDLHQSLNQHFRRLICWNQHDDAVDNFGSMSTTTFKVNKNFWTMTTTLVVTVAFSFLFFSFSKNIFWNEQNDLINSSNHLTTHSLNNFKFYLFNARSLANKLNDCFLYNSQTNLPLFVFVKLFSMIKSRTPWSIQKFVPFIVRIKHKQDKPAKQHYITRYNSV